MQRRNFLQIAAMVPAAAALSPSLSLARTGRPSPTLVLVELAGGNDGLNTVIPYADPAYARLRPNLAIERSQVVQLGASLGLHPALAPLRGAWKDRELAVISGVGYADPNRSHFRSIEIWETGSASDTYLDDGWLARALPSHQATAVPIDGLVLGDRDLGPVHGANNRGILMARPEAFFRLARALGAPSAKARAAANPALAHILRVQGDIAKAAYSVEKLLDAAPEPKGTWEQNRFAKQLNTVAKLMLAGADIPVFKVTLGGFDTHANQPGKHQRLLATLGKALAAFRRAVRPSKRWGSTLVLTYSEFGRRAAENGSRGTDHGTAAPHFAMGGAVKGGHYGKTPSLTALSAGDLVHTVDFRQVYATVLKRHFHLSKLDPALAGQRPLNFLA